MSNPLDRRHFLKLTTTTALAAAITGNRASAFESPEALYRKVIPAKKGLDAQWAGSLIQRLAPLDASIQTSKPEELKHIGMTVGGIGCGTVYLSGDGQLYVWDIFHRPHEGVVAQRLSEIPEGLEMLSGHKKIVRERDGSNYIKPPTPETFPNPFRQEFVFALDGEKVARPLHQKGWKQVKFTGQWPLGTVDYADPEVPATIQLKSWTPFIPLDTTNSSLPVTVMQYTVSNPSPKAFKASLTAIWENPVLVHTRKKEAHEVTSEVNATGDITLLSHRPKSDKPMPMGDWGTATLACLGKAIPTPDQAGLVKTIQLQPGESTTVTFLLTWHFPNIPKLDKLGACQPHYTKCFKDADAVAHHVADNLPSLSKGTFDWVAIWNDSTLPQWVLDRSILTTNTLQTTTCEIVAGDDYPEGRFWAWEGIGCCPGTCAHVWHYAQGVARLFPSLERNLREITDYGIGYNEDGSIRFRAESNRIIAIDAQTGIILRTWREHLMTSDNAFLERVWPRAKQALQWLIEFDSKDKDGLDGLLDGEQHNTLDAEWYGKVHCLCSLYLAALVSGQAMAAEMGDTEFSNRCLEVPRLGSKKIATLFNGEFYEQQEDPAKLDKIGVGKGCYIDQVIGQWWAHQIGLGRIYDAKQIRSALDSLWRYNFVPHIGTFRQAFNRGRFYALGDDAGLIMCSWPKGGLRDDFKKHWQYGYFNECMTGFEWQAAAHMIQEGEPVTDQDPAADLLDDSSNPKAHTLRGLAISRAIHDRYHPALRNPYNEIECSDHYARANASYSVFLALCGFEYDGPRGILGFAPKLNPHNFKAAFTAAKGWGSFEQKHAEGKWTAVLSVVHGSLKLHDLKLPWIEHTKVQASITGYTKGNGAIHYPGGVTLKSGDKLTITC